MNIFSYLLPVAHAQNVRARDAAFALLEKINEVILFPLIALLMAIAFLYFLWGGFEFVKNANNESGRETGKQHMLYGTLGMLVMLSAFAILNIAAGTFGLQGELDSATNQGSPFAPVTTGTRPDQRPSGAPTTGESGSPTSGENGAPTTGESGSPTSGLDAYEAAVTQLSAEIQSAGFNYDATVDRVTDMTIGDRSARSAAIQSNFDQGYISSESYNYMMNNL